MIRFELLDPRMTHEALGFIPGFLDEGNLATAREQLNENYGHGGGWRPFKGFTMLPDRSIKYPGDPAMKPLAKGKLHDEEIYFYRSAWVAIVQPNGDYEISWMD